MNTFYSYEELVSLGLKRVGEDVRISKKASIYSPELLTLGNHVRIDDFTILSGKIFVGDYVHISAFSAIFGKFGVRIGNFCGLSPRSTIFSASDDFSGNYLISPLVPNEFFRLESGEVVLEDYCQLGTNSTVMPRITLHEGTILGAYSFLKNSTDAWSIYTGIPAKFLKTRNKRAKLLGSKLL